jgi:hypothetical protein
MEIWFDDDLKDARFQGFFEVARSVGWLARLWITLASLPLTKHNANGTNNKNPPIKRPINRSILIIIIAGSEIVPLHYSVFSLKISHQNASNTVF